MKRTLWSGAISVIVLAMSAPSAGGVGSAPSQSTRIVDLRTQASVVLDGADTWSMLGESVASAGDVNGDGLGDVIVGAGGDPLYLQDFTAAAVVLFGSRIGKPIDANALGGGGFVIGGLPYAGLPAVPVASANDINDDGLGDIFLAPSDDLSSKFFVFGKRTATAVPLPSLGDRGFVVRPRDPFDGTGSAAPAGDVNGDGRQDVILSTPGSNFNGRHRSGSAYVIFGGAPPSSWNLEALGANGFRIDGAAADDSILAVAAAGDVNGDGIDDVMVGTSRSARFQSAPPGAVYVVFGQHSRANVDLAVLGTRGFEIDGAEVDDQVGTVIAGVGDMNADGLDDLGISAPGAANAHGKHAGAVFVVYGRKASDPVLLTSPDLRGFRVDGLASNGPVPIPVSSAGDFNGDGYPDLLIGTPYTVNGTPDTVGGNRIKDGSAFVIYGRAQPESVDLGSLGDRGLQLDGGPSELAGFSVGSAGDFNGDGRNDIVIGAPFAHQGLALRTGSTFILFGSGRPALAYPPLTLQPGRKVRLVPRRARATGTAWFSVRPALPKGLSINASTGVIRGRVVSAPERTYIVTMHDLTGGIRAPLSLRVKHR